MKCCSKKEEIPIKLYKFRNIIARTINIDRIVKKKISNFVKKNI